MPIPFRLRRAEWVAGGFLIVSAAIGLAALFVVMREQGYFERRFDYYVELKEGYGISPGGTVSIAGIGAGQIEAVTLTDENRVLVRFNVRAAYADRLREDSIVEVDSPVGLSGVLGGKGIVVKIGSPESPVLAPGARLHGKDPESILDLIARITGGSEAEDLKAVIHDVRVLADDLSSPTGSLRTLLADASVIAGEIARGDGSVGRILRDEGKLFDRVDAIAAGAEDAAARLGPLIARLEPSLAKLETALARVDEATKPLPAATAELPAIAAELRALSTELGTIVAEVHRASPLVAELLGETDRLLADLGEVIVSAKRFYLIRINLDDIPDGPVVDAPGR